MSLPDPHDLGALYDAHAASVYSAAHGILRDHAGAQDVVHDVFLRLWRRPELYDPSRGDMRTLLRVMARSRALDLLRRGERARRAQERLESVAELEARDPVQQAAPHPDRAALIEEMRRLPQAQREAVLLAYWGGLTTEEIARHKDLPLGTAKSRIRLGLSKLRESAEAA